MRDVEWITRKGRINIKALTPRAVDVLLADMHLPFAYKDVSGVFFMGVDPFNLDAVLARLRALGLQTEEDKPDEEAAREALRKLTEF